MTEIYYTKWILKIVEGVLTFYFRVSISGTIKSKSNKFKHAEIFIDSKVYSQYECYKIITDADENHAKH